MNLALAILTGFLQIAIFPRLALAWLAPFAFTPLLVALAREPRPWARVRLAYLSGVVFWLGECYWIQGVLAHHGGLGEAGGWATFVLFCLAKSLLWGVFGWLAGRLIQAPYAIPAIAALWAGLERLQGPTTGFEWLMLGNAAIDMGVPMRLAPITGVYGVSFVLMMMSAAVALVVLRRPRAHLLGLLPAAALYAIPALPDARQPAEFSAAVVQPNVTEFQEWTGDSLASLEKRLGLLSLEAALKPGQKPAGIIVWPELPAPIYYRTDIRLKDEVAELIRVTRTPLLLGTVVYDPNHKPLNSAQLIARDGSEAERYDKIYLVPFGEFVPPIFGWVKRITSEISDFAPGDKIVTMSPYGRKVAVFICYEAAIPRLVREFAKEGAEAFFNISNDGYFFRTAAREQHLSLVRMRAAENRRWIVRATNNGITAAIDPAGRVVRQLEPFTETSARMDYGHIAEITPYSRYGDWFPWLCLFTSVTLCVRRRA